MFAKHPLRTTTGLQLTVPPGWLGCGESEDRPLGAELIMFAISMRRLRYDNSRWAGSPAIRVAMLSASLAGAEIR